MLKPEEQALLDNHLKAHETESKPLEPIEIDLSSMTLRDLETYREATTFQMLSVVHEHLGDVELYMHRKEDIDAITRDEKKLTKVKDRLLSLIRDEKKKLKENEKTEIKKHMDLIDNLIVFRDARKEDQKSDEKRKQRTAEWKYDYFRERIELINKEIRRKRLLEFGMAFMDLIDSFLILLHVKKKPRS